MSFVSMLLLVSVGSGLGGICRFLLAMLIKSPVDSFPLATLVTNFIWLPLYRAVSWFEC